MTTIPETTQRATNELIDYQQGSQFTHLHCWLYPTRFVRTNWRDYTPTLQLSAPAQEYWTSFGEWSAVRKKIVCEYFKSSSTHAFRTRCANTKKWNAMNIGAIGTILVGEEFAQRLGNCGSDREKGVVAEDLWTPFLFLLLKFHGDLLQKHFLNKNAT